MTNLFQNKSLCSLLFVIVICYHLNYIVRDGFVRVKQRPIDHLEKNSKGKGGDADDGKDEMAKKEMGGKVVWEAGGKFKIADESNEAAKLIKDWQGCAEKMSSIKEKWES